MRKPYIRYMSGTWFLETRGYRKFMIRELTSVFIAGYLLFLLVWLYRLSQGPQQYETMRQALRSPVAVTLNLLVLAAALYHSITWFNITPKITPVRIGEERVPDILVALGMGYVPWLLFSALVLWIVLR